MSQAKKAERSVTYDRMDIKAAYDQVAETIEAFNREWPAWVRHAEIYPIPLRNEATPLDQVTPEYVSGDEAIDVAKEALASLEWQDDQHVVTTWRVPGVIVLDRPIGDEIEKVNCAKKRLESLMRQVPQGSRAQVRRSLFPHTSLLQVYRKLVYVESVRRLLFTWNGHSKGSGRLTTQQVEKLLLDSERPEDKTPDEWERIINMELKSVRALDPGCQIRRRRSTAPHPRVMHYLAGVQKGIGEARHDGQHHANLPVFVYQPTDHPLPQIDALGAFDAGCRRAERSDRWSYRPLIAKLALYVVE